MRCFHLLLALVLGVGAAAAAVADRSASAKVDPARIDKLVQQLASPKFAERARARQELKRIGEPALEALRKATKSNDAEQSRAATDLVRGIEEKLQNASILAPKRVKLDVNDMPVLDAINELSRQSGYPILVVGDRSALAGRKVTLKTGETTFWEAFDQLCQKGGLVETTQLTQYRQPVPRPRPIRPRIRIQPAPAPGVVPPAPAIKPPAGGLNVKVQVNGVAIAAAAAVAQVQIQAPGQPALPVQVVPGRARAIRRVVPVPNGQLAVQAGTPQKLPTCYAGAVRVRAMTPPPGLRGPQGEKQIYLEVTAEPRLQQFFVTGTPQLTKAVDDQGQHLGLAGDGPGVVNPFNGGVNPAIIARRYYTPYGVASMGRQTVVLRLKTGEKQAKSLKELAGTLTAQVLAPTEPLITVKNVLKAAGKAVKGASGGSMEVASITKENNGDYKLQVRLEDPQGGNPFGAMVFPGGGVQQIQIQINGGVVVQRVVGGGSSPGMPALVDAKGQAYQLVQVPSRSLRGVGGVVTQEVTLVFRPHAGQGAPASLVLNGQRTVTVSVPFRLENVPLP